MSEENTNLTTEQTDTLLQFQVNRERERERVKKNSFKLKINH